MPNAGIMLVEDEVVLLSELQDYLEDMGYQIRATATNGEEALALAAQTRPDLVLMDINLRGGMDGIEAARRLRAAGGVPTIFLTAHADTKTLEEAKAAQPFGYLVKPVEPLELRAAIEMALVRIQLERERDELLAKLRHALSQVKMLSGLLPICSHCKKIRNEHSQWETIENYIDKRSEASFTHGICPECVRLFYPDLADEI